MKIDHLRDPMQIKYLRPLAILALLNMAFSGLQAQTYTQIEAAEYDPVYDRWLVSNGSSIIAQANDGTLSYFGSATANYGMEVMGDKLFAISSSAVKGYDLATGTQVMSVNISGAGFLNGMASDGNNRLWVTDFSTKKIHEIDVTNLSSPAVTVIVNNTVSTPNGITHDPANDRLVFVNWGGSAAVKAISLSDYTVSTLLTTALSNCDGIDIDGTGNFYVSSWSPTRITKFNNDFSISEIIPATGLSSPADISYAQEIDVLGVANSGNETLTLIEFTPSSLTESPADIYGMKLFPNPMVSNSLLEFDLGTDRILDIQIYDITGRKVKSLLKSKNLQGFQRMILDRSGLNPGFYSIVLSTSRSESTLPFVVSID